MIRGFASVGLAALQRDLRHDRLASLALGSNAVATAAGFIATAGGDGSVALHRLADGEPTARTLGPSGKVRAVAFSPSGEITVRPMTLPAERVRELEAHLMLIFTGINRTASDVAGTYANEPGGNGDTIRRIGDMVDEGIALLAGRDDIAGFGRLLHESWQAKRALSRRVSNRWVEGIYESAIDAGAIGGKLMGAGGGGFLLLFARPEAHAPIRDRLRGLLNVPFRFETSGSQIIFFDEETDYSREDGARDLDAPRPSP